MPGSLQQSIFRMFNAIVERPTHPSALRASTLPALCAEEGDFFQCPDAALLPPPPKAGRVARSAGWGVCTRGDLSSRVFSECSTQSSNTSQPRNPTRPPCGRTPSPRFARRREIFSMPLCCTSPSTAEGGEGGAKRRVGCLQQGRSLQQSIFSMLNPIPARRGAGR